MVAEARRFVETVVVVDDGSSDDTAAAASGAAAIVLGHDENRGKGAALNTGLQWLCERKFEWALTLDGDGQHLAADIPVFWQCAESTGAPLIVGNRMAHPAGMPRLRRWVNRWMSRRLSSLAGCSLPDTQNGYRLINLKVWKCLTVRASKFEIESEILLAFALAGYAIQFVPVQVVYAGEVSKIRPCFDSLRWFRWWWKARRRSRSQ